MFKSCRQIYFKNGSEYDAAKQPLQSEHQRTQCEDEVEEGAIQLPPSRLRSLPSTNAFDKRLFPQIDHEGRKRGKAFLSINIKLKVYQERQSDCRRGALN